MDKIPPVNSGDVTKKKNLNRKPTVLEYAKNSITDPSTNTSSSTDLSMDMDMDDTKIIPKFVATFSETLNILTPGVIETAASVLMLDVSGSMFGYTQALEDIARRYGYRGELKTGGGTAIYDTLVLLYRWFRDNRVVVKDLVLITDGLEHGRSDSKTVIETIRKLRESFPGIQIHLIVVDNKELADSLYEEGAANPFPTVASVTNPSLMEQIASVVQRRANTGCTESLLVYSSPDGQIMKRSSAGTRACVAEDYAPISAPAPDSALVSASAPVPDPISIPIGRGPTEFELRGIVKDNLKNIVLRRLDVPEEDKEAFYGVLLHVVSSGTDKITPSLTTGKSPYSKLTRGVRGECPRERMAPYINRAFGTFLTTKYGALKIFEMAPKVNGRPTYAVVNQDYLAALKHALINLNA